MWTDMNSFIETVKRAYKKDVWPTQENYVEVWLEKDALSGLFVEVLEPLGITLNVGRGYDGWSSIHNAALRLKDKEQEDHRVHVLYFGDFDPSGEDMYTSLIERLNSFDIHASFTKCALTKEQIEEYNLPTDPAKTTDRRTKDFIEKNGDISVELDALPVNILKDILLSEVTALLNMERLEENRRLEQEEVKILIDTLNRN
jgi:hypothetical protein